MALNKALSQEAGEVGVEELPKDFVSSLTTLFGHGCEQRLLRGKYGITAFELLEPKVPEPKRRVLVFSHGLGQNWAKFAGAPFLETFREAGYTVLAYSFYGHAWSYAGDHVMGTGGTCCGGPLPTYDEEVHMCQVGELLKHVMDPGEAVDCWVGHSTGGVVGVLAAAKKVWPIRTFGNVSPAFWAEKPCFSKFVERFTCMLRPIMNTSAVKAGEGDYFKNCDRAFGKDASGKHLFPEIQKLAEQKILKNFAHHPQLTKAIGSISVTFLGAHMMEGHQNTWKQLVQSDLVEKMFLVWGTRDIVVPCAHAQDVVSWNPQRVKLASPELGHESIFEDPTGVANIIVEGLKDQ